MADRILAFSRCCSGGLAAARLLKLRLLRLAREAGGPQPSIVIEAHSLSGGGDDGHFAANGVSADDLKDGPIIVHGGLRLSATAMAGDPEWQAEAILARQGSDQNVENDGQ